MRHPDVILTELQSRFLPIRDLALAAYADSKEAGVRPSFTPAMGRTLLVFADDMAKAAEGVRDWVHEITGDTSERELMDRVAVSRFLESVSDALWVTGRDAPVWLERMKLVAIGRITPMEFADGFWDEAEDFASDVIMASAELVAVRTQSAINRVVIQEDYALEIQAMAARDRLGLLPAQNA